jgi:esterase
MEVLHLLGGLLSLSFNKANPDQTQGRTRLPAAKPARETIQGEGPMQTIESGIRSCCKTNMKTICASFVLAVGLLIGAALTPVMAAPNWPVPSGVKTVEVNGYPIAYIEAGAGVPVLLLHGMFVDHRYFAPQMAEFSKTHRVIAVSLRHHYPEPWNGKDGAYSVNQHASDVAALIRQLNLGKVHLLGHSRGGSVAINVAQQAPELIRTLILEDPAGLGPLLADDSACRKNIAGMTQLATWVSSELEKGDRRATAQATWTMFFGPGAWEYVGPEMQQFITDNIGTAATKAPLEALAISCDDIRKFAFPVLILHGERSPKIYSELSEAMRKCKPGLAPAIIVPNATHLIHRDNPTFFNKAVLDFLQRN